jgi:hypothetical protein
LARRKISFTNAYSFAISDKMMYNIRVPKKGGAIDDKLQETLEIADRQRHEKARPDGGGKDKRGDGGETYKRRKRQHRDTRQDLQRAELQ